jgi:hypothetical protein
MRTRSGYRTVDGKDVWQTTVYVVDQEQYESGPFAFGESYEDGSLKRVIESLIAIRESIPAEFRERARCEISSTGGYEGSHYATIEVSYERPETPEETANREENAGRARALADAKQRAEYDKLKAKFG